MPSYSSTELQLTWNTADCVAAPRRNFEADSAAPWQRAPPLHHVQVAAVRAAWHQWWPSLRAPPGETPLRAMLLTAWCLYCCTGWHIIRTLHLNQDNFFHTKTKISLTHTHPHRRSVFFFSHVAIRNSLRSNNNRIRHQGRQGSEKKSEEGDTRNIRKNGKTKD